ncbi:ABC transporter ATP-binding protein [Camelimonas abortus]|uniref:ABC transporter ATP-binding protein n=1 Tax=Camelimonas abortus TaxID=1017184 RepID=A0ABV7LAL7_9HYPH
MTTPLLSVEGLTLDFDSSAGPLHALDDVSFAIAPGECVALVGESGSGKSVTGLAVMRLLAKRAVIRSGRIMFGGQDLLRLGEREMRAARGRRIAMIFQNAKNSLNPIRSIGDILVDLLRTHTPGLSRREAHGRIVELLGAIGIAAPEKRMRAYPSELSGGMCQRIMIAAAFACNPELIIADEPTSALDVTTQQLVMELLMKLCRERGVATVFITHDLALASEWCDRAIVMHAGQILETGPVAGVLEAPRHPYTRMLLDSLPYGKESVTELRPMGGALPNLRRADLPRCRFAGRCPRVSDVCVRSALPDRVVGPGHVVRCHHALAAGETLATQARGEA